MRKLSSLLLITTLILSLTLIGCSNEYEFDRVELLYSQSMNQDFNKYIEYINDYDTYLELGYSLDDVSKSTFDTHILYMYHFTNNNLGENIYLFDHYDIKNGVLNLYCKENEDIQVSPAFGEYAMIFVIDKTLVDDANSIQVVFE